MLRSFLRWPAAYFGHNQDSPVSAMITFVPVVDLSRNQGATDFVKMRRAGVRGLILRVGNGQTVDDHFEPFYNGALDAGFTPADMTFYSFINPKRGTGAQCAVAMLDEIHRVTGHLEVGYMADCEWYASQSPNSGQAPVFGPSYAAWLREHRATVALQAPAARQFGYSDEAFWNGSISPGSTSVWVGDDQLAGEIDWIVPRYPAYSDAAYAKIGYPGAPETWADWAMRAQPEGPLPPRGGSWLGWQPSAGWNRQGATYGVTSRDLDLNIVDPDAWARWTGTSSPNPQPEDDMKLYHNSEDRQMPYGLDGAGHVKFLVGTDKRNIGPHEYVDGGWNLVTSIGMSNADLNAIPDAGAPASPPVIDYVALAGELAKVLPHTFDGTVRLTAAG